MVRIQLINYMLCLLMIYCCDSSQHEGTNFVDSRDAVKIMEVKCTKEEYMVTGQVMWAIIILIIILFIILGFYPLSTCVLNKLHME